MGWVSIRLSDELHDYIRLRRIKEGKSGVPRKQGEIILEMLLNAKKGSK